MTRESSVTVLSRLAAPQLGVFTGSAAEHYGVSRKQIAAYASRGVLQRVLPDVYRMTAVAPTNEQRLRAALLWGGDGSAAACRSAGERYACEGVFAPVPEILVPRGRSCRSIKGKVVVYRPERVGAMMIREHRGIRVTGPEATLVSLAPVLDGEAFEVACEDARRRRLTTVPALYAYLDRFGASGRDGVRQLRALLKELDPVHPSRSTLEVKTRRLLAVSGITHFVREFPLDWNGTTYYYDFAFEPERVILETNGRRWHDDPRDYEYDHEKWSVPARHGYRLILATWPKVDEEPDAFEHEVRVALAAGRS